jgi:hypothetical protein
MHLAAHPEDDADMCRVLQMSGYLSLWHVEMEKNPWQYRLDLMSAEPHLAILTYCQSVTAGEDGGANRFIANRGGYELFSRQYGLGFFQLMVGLYDILASLHRTRVETARQWLVWAGFPAPAPASLPVPHTPGWFASMREWDPPKAMMTQVVIEAVGRSDVCSVCGDDPASDYQLAEAQRPPGGPSTLRLCEDCVKIRRSDGEDYQLMPPPPERPSYQKADAKARRA